MPRCVYCVYLVNDKYKYYFSVTCLSSRSTGRDILILFINPFAVLNIADFVNMASLFNAVLEAAHR
jgi:hypothetical protein